MIIHGQCVCKVQITCFKQSLALQTKPHVLEGGTSLSRSRIPSLHRNHIEDAKHQRVIQNPMDKRCNSEYCRTWRRTRTNRSSPTDTSVCVHQGGGSYNRPTWIHDIYTGYLPTDGGHGWIYAQGWTADFLASRTNSARLNRDTFSNTFVFIKVHQPEQVPIRSVTHGSWSYLCQTI